MLTLSIVGNRSKRRL